MIYPNWYLKERNAIKKANEAWLRRASIEEKEILHLPAAIRFSRNQSGYEMASLNELYEFLD